MAPRVSRPPDPQPGVDLQDLIQAVGESPEALVDVLDRDRAVAEDEPLRPVGPDPEVRQRLQRDAARMRPRDHGRVVTAAPQDCGEVQPGRRWNHLEVFRERAGERGLDHLVSRGVDRPHAPDVPGEVSVPAEGRASTTYFFHAPGPVEYACHLPGHYEYGMHGIVEVVAGETVR